MIFIIILIPDYNKKVSNNKYLVKERYIDENKYTSEELCNLLQKRHFLEKPEKREGFLRKQVFDIEHNSVNWEYFREER